MIPNWVPTWLVRATRVQLRHYITRWWAKTLYREQGFEPAVLALLVNIAVVTAEILYVVRRIRAEVSADE